jgi:hypothetical protein
MDVTEASGPLVRLLRDADWLTETRARRWCRILAVITLTAALAWIGLSHGGLDLMGKPLGTDFISFWTASRLALDGQPALAYDPPVHLAEQRALFPSLASQTTYAAFFYPPTFLLLCLPFALLPYLVALIIWLGAGFSALFICLRRLLPESWAILPIVAFPGMVTNVENGQNGFLSAACLGAGMVLTRHRPFVAGICLGVLVFKPHLMLEIPVALLAARRWAVIAGAVTSASALVGLSVLVLGIDAWRAFLEIAPAARTTLEQGQLFSQGLVQSAFGAVRILHGDITLAYLIQSIISILATVVLARSARRQPGAYPEGALLIAATMLGTPYLVDYDLACLALPIAWVMREALRTEWLPWEKTVLLAAYTLPLVARILAIWVGVPIAPLVLTALLVAVARRARRKVALEQ